MTCARFRPVAWARAVACVACVACASPAFAQRANGPYAGLLGTMPPADLSQALNVTGQLYGEYDQNTLPPLLSQSGLDPRLAGNGGGGGASGTLNYQFVSDRVRVGLGGGAAGRAFPGDASSIAGTYSGNGSLSANLTPKLVLDASGSAGYSPFYNFAPFAGATFGGMAGGSFAGQAGAPGFAYAAFAERNVALQGTAGITSNFSKRSSLSFRFNDSEIRMLDGPAGNVRTTWAQADFTHKLTRALSLHLGYGRQLADYMFGPGGSYRNDTIQAGLDYGDTLTFSRRTSVAFSASTMTIRYLGSMLWRVNGSAQLTRGFGRSWSTWAGYVRDTAFDPAFRGPMLTDTANGGFGGQIALRTKWSTTVGYTRGSVGFESGAFTAYGASSRLEFALTRVLGFYSQYTYYRYDMPPGLSTIGLIQRFTRQSAMAGLNVWLPVINQTRPPKEPSDK